MSVKCTYCAAQGRGRQGGVDACRTVSDPLSCWEIDVDRSVLIYIPAQFHDLSSIACFPNAVERRFVSSFRELNYGMRDVVCKKNLLARTGRHGHWLGVPL